VDARQAARKTDTAVPFCYIVYIIEHKRGEGRIHVGCEHG
jgi:hypothetical protein